MSKVNSIIFNHPEKESVFDYSSIGTECNQETDTIVQQENHFLRVGDIIYYDIKEGKFLKAIAKNTNEIEVCGIVNQVFSKHKFSFITKGIFKTDKYAFPLGTPLYLSEVTHGKIVSIEGESIVKQVGVQINNGIAVNIQRSIMKDNKNITMELEPYTDEDINEIIANVW